MKDIERLKAIFMPILTEMDVQLYDLAWVQNGKERTLQVSIMRPDGSMDLDTCASVSERLSQKLDEADEEEGAYTLEVCSPGAERTIYDLAELKTLPYVHVHLKQPIDGSPAFTGQVVAYEEHNVTLSYRDKAATRQVHFTAADIDWIRHAVKI